MEDNTFGQEVRDFLSKPDRQQFHGLYKSSFVRCRGYLRYLRAKNWALPLDARTDKDPIGDLAIDILGHLYSCDKTGRPFYIVFDYFKRLGIRDYRKVDPERLAGLFMALLTRFTRQELYRINESVNPALAKIKRRWKDILKGKEYTFVSTGNDSRKCVCLTSSANNLKHSGKPVDRKLLEELVTDSLLHTKKDTDLCRMFFRRLNEYDKYQNFVDLHQLLSVVVSVRVNYAEEGFPAPFPMVSPEMKLLLGQVEEAKERALKKVWESDIKGFIARKRITPKEGNTFHKACGRYLDDHCNGGTDPIPHYFFEINPTVSQKLYLARFKYPFDTIIERALRYLRDEFIDNSINVSFGDY